MGDAMLIEVLPFRDIFILRNAGCGWVIVSNKILNSDVSFVLCSRSSFVECWD